MISTSTLSSETINGEGLVGFHLGDGATYVYLTGEEYFDIFPYWDFQLIPGTTVEYGTTCPVDHHVGHYGTTSTVGGASNGLATVAAWEFQAPSFAPDVKHKDYATCVQSLSYHRTTVFMRDCFVVLTAAMSSNTSSPVVTTLDSRALNGSVTVWSSIESSPQRLPRGSHAASKIEMLHHNSIVVSCERF